MLSYDSPGEAVATRPAAVRNVGETQWERLESAILDPRRVMAIKGAWDNGRTFLNAADGLRGRTPLRIEWKGPHHPPGYDLLPADLRIDHVFLVSCKYLSRILMNPSPGHLFDRVLEVRAGGERVDWYEKVAPKAYDALYAEVRSSIGEGLPESRQDLTREQRNVIKGACARRWPASVEEVATSFSAAVSEASAVRWRATMPTSRHRELMLWRLLRLNSSPYFVLGTSAKGTLRLRIGTPWDWRQLFELKDLDVTSQPSGQPVVGWSAQVKDLDSGGERRVQGHVEVRWSHGRFCGMPEAKVYLDTPHNSVPGYFPFSKERPAEE